jgi:hypothetical protein
VIANNNAAPSQYHFASIISVRGLRTAIDMHVTARAAGTQRQIALGAVPAAAPVGTSCTSAITDSC